MSEICKICGLPKELCVCSELPKEPRKKRIIITVVCPRKSVRCSTVVSGNFKDAKDLVKRLRKKFHCTAERKSNGQIIIHKSIEREELLSIL